MSSVAKKLEPETTRYPRRQGAPTRRAGLPLMRTVQKITQVELAERMDITQGRISEIEAAGDELQLSTLRAYAKALGYELEVCFTKNNLRTRVK
jgi:predicted transcriptional regulator